MEDRYNIRMRIFSWVCMLLMVFMFATCSVGLEHGWPKVEPCQQPQ